MFDKLAIWRSRSDARAEGLQALHAHAGLIITAAARVLGNIADAEDVAQDLAEKLLRSPPEDVRSWPALLKTMAVNAALDRVRQRRDWSHLEPPPAPAEPESNLEDHQRARVLRQAIAGLSPRDARLFSLCYFADLDHAQIALELDMTPNAVGVALHRLRQRLATDVRARLGLHDHGDAQ